MNKNHPIQIMVTANIKAKIKKLADDKSMSMTQFILSRCFKTEIEERVEEMFKKIIELKGRKK